MHPLPLCLTTRQRFSFTSYVPPEPPGALCAFRNPVSIVVLLVPLLLVACGGNHSGAPAGERVSYTLTPGSQIVFSPPPPIKAPTIVQPLSGTFTVVRGAVPGPNALLHFSVTSFRFQSSDFTIGGNTGSIDASTIPIPLQAQMSATVSINGRSVELNGSGPFESSTDPPAFRDLEVCGAEGESAVTCDEIHSGAGGYSLLLFAVPNNFMSH